MFWRNKEEVALQTYSSNHIDVIVHIQGWDPFRLTGIYGEPNRTKRRDTWNLIRHLHAQNQIPWVLIGDMNNVLGQADKRGGPLYPSWLINGFQEVLEDCDLHDMDLQGYPYTWERGHGTDKWVEIRLDRAIASRTWLEVYKDAKLVNLNVTTSDHSPILLEPVIANLAPRTRKLKFENAWLREPVCKLIVEDSWRKNQNEMLQQIRVGRLL
ncbi:Endonuclease/exonuclease/phosphatase family protein [Heracleum sosnowskyi]|uniref:Endonuclease/exonuclease/phosphatase family protein n=1 Tax=Heracleum sosnowskyi TaxID=360622 RepID=A0AAD8IB86_9APIA|nr:Endonuclease/exonuclease/phosphatase family protein [Heracleum sosnowskyi]